MNSIESMTKNLVEHFPTQRIKAEKDRILITTDKGIVTVMHGDQITTPAGMIQVSFDNAWLLQGVTYAQVCTSLAAQRGTTLQQRLVHRDDVVKFVNRILIDFNF